MNDLWSQSIEAQQPSAKPEWLTEDIEIELTSRKLPLNQDGMLMLWQAWQNNLTEAKDLEIQYRKICATFLVPQKTEGTTNVELGNGFKAKVVNKYNYKLNSDNDIVWAILDKIGKIGNQGKFVAERLVSWHPSFLKQEYNILEDEASKGDISAIEILKIVNKELITITEGAPVLDIIEPKVSKKK